MQHIPDDNINQRVDQLNHMDEDVDDINDSLDDIDGENNADTDYASRDGYDMLTQVTDTSAAQARKGKDIQGIPWHRLNITRQDYRLTRILQYQNYENIPSSGDTVDKDCTPTSKGQEYYEFFHNTRLVKPTILHFQLRNLVWATSKHDVYLMSNSSVLHWSSLSHNLSEVLNFSGHITPTEKHAGSLLEGFTQTQISTIAVKDRFVIAGGFQGEIICKSLDKQGVSFCARTTYEENAITNSIDIYKSKSGMLNFIASNNDGGVREYDMEKYQLINYFRFPWAVNHTSISPDRKLLTVVGDDLDSLVVDAHNGKTVGSVVGHLDYSFASAWHPEGHIFATGNQDKTCRVWDVRKLSVPIAVLRGKLGAVRSIRFSSDGQFLVAAEPADFVHIYNTKANYKMEQEIDFFGEISGVALSPDDESLYVGLWDRTYASLMQYNRRHLYEEMPSTSAVEGEEAERDLGPSWLRSGFVMPEEEGALRELADEISRRTPPLRNLCFTNRYAAAFIGGAILDRAADVDSLVGMGELSIDEATNRAGALLAQVSSLLLYISRSRSSVEDGRAVDAEWRATNEPRLAALESVVKDQTTRLELAESEKLQLTSEVSDLKEWMLKAEEEIAELRAANAQLNTARDEAVAGQLSIQEELKHCKSESFKKNIINDFRSSVEYHEEIGREAGSFLNKGYVHIIRQLHPHFEDKSVLVRAYQANFDNEVCRQGADFVPFTEEELEALRERDEKRGRPYWKAPQPSASTFWDMLDGSGSAP